MSKELLGGVGKGVEIGIVAEGRGVGRGPVVERACPFAVNGTYAMRLEARLDHDLSQV
jgi:hypothetical protein